MTGSDQTFQAAECQAPREWRNEPGEIASTRPEGQSPGWPRSPGPRAQPAGPVNGECLQLPWLRPGMPAIEEYIGKPSCSRLLGFMLPAAACRGLVRGCGIH